ncbi:MAG: DUF4176 domain-containing protein [Mycoplasmatales bacterium]
MKFYPLGTVFKLETSQQYIIIGRGLVVRETKTGEKKFIDYIACQYPMGVMYDSTYVSLNHEEILEVIVTGPETIVEHVFQMKLMQTRRNYPLYYRNN